MRPLYVTDIGDNVIVGKLSTRRLLVEFCPFKAIGLQPCPTPEWVIRLDGEYVETLPIMNILNWSDNENIVLCLRSSGREWELSFAFPDGETPAITFPTVKAAKEFLSCICR